MSDIVLEFKYLFSEKILWNNIHRYTFTPDTDEPEIFRRLKRRSIEDAATIRRAAISHFGPIIGGPGYLERSKQRDIYIEYCLVTATGWTWNEMVMSRAKV